MYERAGCRPLSSSRSYLLRWVLSLLLEVVAAESTYISDLAGPRTREMFLGRVPTKVLFPECGIQGAPACAYDVIVIAQETREGIRPVVRDYEAINLLPLPLLGSVLFDRRYDPEECPLQDLASELAAAEQRSLRVGSGGFASASTSLTSTCFGLKTPETAPQVVLIWVSGLIRGWVSCKVRNTSIRVCELHVYSPPPTDASSDLTYSIVASPIHPDAVRPLLENVHRFGNRLIDLIQSQTKTRPALDVPANVLVFDDHTTDLFPIKLQAQPAYLLGGEVGPAGMW